MTRTLTILEGADATGKSAHARWLIEWALGDDTALLHYGPPSGNWRKDYWVRLTERPMVNDTVLDRSFIGSRVWARLGFHPEPLRERDWRMVCWTYARHSDRVGAMVVVRDVKEIRDEIHRRKEGSQAAVDAQVGQMRFLQLLANNEVYYIPIAAHTSNRLHYMRERGN